MLLLDTAWNKTKSVADSAWQTVKSSDTLKGAAIGGAGAGAVSGGALLLPGIVIGAVVGHMHGMEQAAKAHAAAVVAQQAQSVTLLPKAHRSSS